MKKLISKLMIWILLVPFISPTVVMAVTQINLTTQVQGILPIGNGGTGSATGLSTTPAKLSAMSVTVGGSAATISAVPQYLDFRSADLTNGAASTVYSNPSNLTIPSGATLGSVSGVQSFITVVEILPTSGVPELAVTNTAGGLAFDEDELISTTAISAGATASGVYYSANARTNVPYRVLGWFESTQATAGTWASAPTTVQGCGSNSCSAMTSLGFGQTWQIVTRTIGTTYYNTTGKAIMVAYAGTNTTAGAQLLLTVNGSQILGNPAYGAGQQCVIQGIIPPGGVYSLTVTAGAFTPTASSMLEFR